MPKKILSNIILAVLIFFVVSLAYLAYPRKLNAPEEAVQLPTKEFYGIIRSKEMGTLYIDEVQFLSGLEARRLGAQDTGCPEKTVEDCIPSLNNDFYIRNIDKSIQAYRISDQASISTLLNPGSPDLASTSAQDFLKIFPRPQIFLPFRILARGDIILSLEEQFTP